MGGRFGVRGFPTIKIFGSNKNKPEDYNGGRTAQGLLEAALSAAKTKIYAQLGGKAGGSSSSKVPVKNILFLNIVLFICCSLLIVERKKSHRIICL